MTENAKNIVAEIRTCLSKAVDLYDNLSSEEKDEILHFHDEVFSLPYCLRWGKQAVEDILED